VNEDNIPTGDVAHNPHPFAAQLFGNIGMTKSSHGHDVHVIKCVERWYT